MNTIRLIAIMLCFSVAAITGCGNTGPQSGGTSESKPLEDWASILRGQSLDEIIQIIGRPDAASEDKPIPGSGGLVRWTSVVYKDRVLDSITGITTMKLKWKAQSEGPVFFILVRSELKTLSS